MNLFKGPAAPAVKPPPPLPDPQAPEAMAAKRKAIASAMQGGRSSTVLTSAPAATTIGGAYSGSKLGGA